MPDLAVRVTTANGCPEALRSFTERALHRQRLPRAASLIHVMKDARDVVKRRPSVSHAHS
jgi:hypothetical protein